jgi:hypothetical protein
VEDERAEVDARLCGPELAQLLHPAGDLLLLHSVAGGRLLLRLRVPQDVDGRCDVQQGSVRDRLADARSDERAQYAGRVVQHLSNESRPHCSGTAMKVELVCELVRGRARKVVLVRELVRGRAVVLVRESGRAMKPRKWTGYRSRTFAETQNYSNFF